MTSQTGLTSRKRLLTRPFVLLCLAEFSYLTADGVALYLVPLHATGPLGSGEAGAGLAFGAFAMCALFLRPLAGRLCDTRGRRPLLIGGALIAAVSLALTAQADSPAQLVAYRVLAGVGEAAVFVAIFAAIADLAPAERLGQAISYNSLALYLGLACGPMLAEVLLRSGSFAVGWYAAAGLALIAAGGFALVPETRVAPPSADSRTPLWYRPGIPVALGFLASVVAMGGFLAFAALHAQRVGLAYASLPLIIYGGVVVVGRVAFASLQDRLPPLTMGALALATIAGGLTLVAVWGSPAGLLAGTAVLAFGVVFSTPALFTAIFAKARPEERGAASAMASACLDLGLGLGPILLGAVAQSAGIPYAMLAGAGAGLAGAGWIWWLRSRSGVRSRPATTESAEGQQETIDLR